MLISEANMDEDRIAGTARKLGGKIQEDVGRFAGDTQTQIKGVANQAAGTAQDLYGQAADAARDTAATFDKWLRNTIETQPYTTAIVALGIWMAVGTDASATLVVNIFGNCAPPQLPSGGVLFLRQTTI